MRTKILRHNTSQDRCWLEQYWRGTKTAAMQQQHLLHLVAVTYRTVRTEKKWRFVKSQTDEVRGYESWVKIAHHCSKAYKLFVIKASNFLAKWASIYIPVDVMQKSTSVVEALPIGLHERNFVVKCEGDSLVWHQYITKPKEKNVGGNGILYTHCVKKWGPRTPCPPT